MKSGPETNRQNAGIVAREIKIHRHVKSFVIAYIIRVNHSGFVWKYMKNQKGNSNDRNFEMNPITLT